MCRANGADHPGGTESVCSDKIVYGLQKVVARCSTDPFRQSQQCNHRPMKKMAPWKHKPRCAEKQVGRCHELWNRQSHSLERQVDSPWLTRTSMRVPAAPPLMRTPSVGSKGRHHQLSAPMFFQIRTASFAFIAMASLLPMTFICSDASMVKPMPTLSNDFISTYNCCR